MKKIAKIVLRALLPLWLVLAVNRSLRKMVALGHRLQFWLQWHVASRPPGWFDHFIDLHWKWHASRDPSPWQRGILGLLAMKPGCRVLDLCCGGGFYAYHFYSSRASRVVAIDWDIDGIRHAQRNMKAPNIEYRQGNILTDMPREEFDNVCWDAGIEYFTQEETRSVLAAIKQQLTPAGILNGCGIGARTDGHSHIDHKHEFSSPQALAQLLREFFANVLVISPPHAGNTRKTFHFFASDGTLPFNPQQESFLLLTAKASS